VSDFDDFYDKLMGEEMSNGETFNEFAESVFTLEEQERDFGKISFDKDDNIWVTDIDDPTFKVKIETMDDFYAFLAKQKLAGGKEW
jgi:hypothetical protein